jgi:ribose transport system substrate-binding protein
MRNFSRLGKVISAGIILSMLAACDSGAATSTPVASTPTSDAGAGAAATNTTAPVAPTDTATTGGAATKSNYVIAMSQANKAEPWREAMNTQIADAAKAHPELKVVFADAAQDNAKQVTDVENFIQQKVDLLIISPNEAAPLTAVVKKAYDSGIPVIVLDRAVNGDAYTMFIGADNVKIGEMAGKFVADWCKANNHAPCNTLEIKGLSGSPPAADRDSGFKTGIASNTNVKIVADPTADWLREKAVPAAAAAFQANEQIDVVYGHNDPMAEGAYIAAKNANKDVSKMLFVGIDGLPTPDGGIMSVLQGREGATFVYPTGGMQAIDWAVKILEQSAKPPKKVVLDTEQIDSKTAPELCKKYNCPGK